MEFSKKYKLIEQLPGEGVQSYRALQMDAGRDVAVHLLVGGKTPENEALLVRLRAMQPQSLARLIEVGEYQGSTFVVTVAPPFQRLEEWLAEQEREAAATKEFGKAGFWKRPDIGAMTAPQPQPAKVPQPPAAGSPAQGPGEFTKQFQLPATPSAGSGDFTRHVPESGRSHNGANGGTPAAARAFSGNTGRRTRRFHAYVPEPGHTHGSDNRATDRTAGAARAPSGNTGRRARRFHAHVPEPGHTDGSDNGATVGTAAAARTSSGNTGRRARRFHAHVPERGHTDGSDNGATVGTAAAARASSGNTGRRTRRFHAHVPERGHAGGSDHGAAGGTAATARASS